MGGLPECIYASKATFQIPKENCKLCEYIKKHRTMIKKEKVLISAAHNQIDINKAVGKSQENSI